MNELQEAIFEVILSILRNDKLHKKFESYPEQIGKPIFQNSAIRYGILNYVAKFSLANNDAGEIGIFATITDGPSLRGDLQELNSMPLGGVLTL